MARQDVIIRMRLAGEDFDREFKAKFADLENAAEQQSLAAGTRSGSSFVKGFLGVAAAGALGNAIGSAIGEAADLGTEILNTSRQFNIGAENLQIWQQAATDAGLSSNDFTNSLGDLTQKIGEANAGNKQAQQSFVDLGIGFETMSGQARATDAVMLDLAARIAEIEDPAERVRLGTQLLGDKFKTLYPLLINGAEGFNKIAAETSQFGNVLTQEELQDLDRLNKSIEKMKDQLSRRVDQVVAQNAEAIEGMASSILGLADAAVKGTFDLINFYRQLSNYAEARKKGFGNPVDQDPVTPQGLADVRRLLDPGVAAPRVTAAAPRRRTGGGGGGGGAPRRDPAVVAAQREAEQAAKAAIRNEEQLRDAIARTLRAQEDSAQVQQIRADQGDEAAAVAEAELNFLRQHPLAVHDTVEALAAALGITKELTDVDKARLQLLIDQGNAAQKAVATSAGAEARIEIDREQARQAEEAQRNAERQAEAFRVLHERAVLDVADFYRTAFDGGIDDIWGRFKDEGLQIIAEIAAQWTLSLLAGQPFNFNSAASSALGRSPLASIFGGGSGFGAANDNGIGGIFGNIGGGGSGAIPSGYLPSGGAIPNTGGGFDAVLRGGGGSLLEQAGQSLALSQLGIAIGGNSSTTGQIGGSLGGLAGSLVGGSIGAIIGSTLGNLLGGLISGTPNGNVTIGNAGGTLGITGSAGGSSSRRETATQGAGSLIDAIFQIADQLGGGVDASRGRVSFGVRGNSFRVDPNGRGTTRVGRGAVDFGSDQEAAIRFAIQDLIKDGVITGISQASQNLLQKGGDLDAQIEKALLIESVPKLLRERLDPLGSALDELYDKFKLLADALREGGASAQQVADAQRLYELEKAEAIASIGAASQTLRDFLESLNAGSNSPLSLREQRAEAERQFEPFLAQITAAESARAEVDRLRASGGSAAEIAAAEAAARTAAAAIDQSGFTEVSQLLLSISRQGNASSGAFFSDFDRIRALTGQAAGFVDQATARDADTRDPFGSAIAQNTQDAAYILAEHTRLLTAMNDNIAALAGGGSGGGFIGEPRLYVDRR